jgi:hypothetical protein
MKINRSFFILGIVTVILSVAVTVWATRPAQPPKASDVTGIYSGYGDQVEFLRLELDADGTGYLCVSYLPDSPARLYRVDSWRLSEWIVEVQTRPLDKDRPEPVTFRKLRVGLFALEGEFGGAGWTRKIKLYGERDWQSRAVPTQERIARYRKEKQ